jgi:hypothetical protein
MSIAGAVGEAQALHVPRKTFGIRPEPGIYRIAL